MRHWLAHRLGWNHGHVQTFWYDRWVWVAFVCECGRWERATPVPRWVMEA